MGLNGGWVLGSPGSSSHRQRSLPGERLLAAYAALSNVEFYVAAWDPLGKRVDLAEISLLTSLGMNPLSRTMTATVTRSRATDERPAFSEPSLVVAALMAN
jgi:hypothetical protein